MVSFANIKAVHQQDRFTIPNFAQFLPQVSNEDDQTLSYDVSTTSSQIENVRIDANGTLHIQVHHSGMELSGLGFFANVEFRIQVRAKDDGGTLNGGQDTGRVHESLIKINRSASENNPPSFTASDIIVDEDHGSTFIANWANFHPGFSEETSGQSALEYIIDDIEHPSFFAIPPSVNPIDGALRFTLANDAFGDNRITLSVRDSGGATEYQNGRGNDRSVSKTFLLRVRQISDQPGFVATDVVTVNEDSGPQSISNWVTEYVPDATPNPNFTEYTPVLVYRVNNISNPSLFADTPVVKSDGTLEFTPAANAVGASTFDVYAIASGGGLDHSATQSYTIVVDPVNDAPDIIAADPPAVLEDSLNNTVPNWVSFSVGPADEASQKTTEVSVINVSNPDLFEIEPSVELNGTLHYRLAPNAAGESTFDVVATDDGGTLQGGVDSSNPSRFKIRVTPVNDAPAVLISDPPTIPAGSGPVVLPQWATFVPGPVNELDQAITDIDVRVSRPDLFESQPEFLADGTLTFEPAHDAEGDATVAIQITDNGGNENGGIDRSPAQFFTITIKPRITVTVPENTRDVLDLTATDFGLTVQTAKFSIAGSAADDDKFEIDADGRLHFKTAPNFEEPTDVGGTPGDNSYHVSVLAHDGNGNTAQEIIQVIVSDMAEALRVDSVVVDDGGSQRSMVRQLTVTFNEEVSIDAGAFVLTNWTTGQRFTIAQTDIAANVVQDKTVVVLTFNNSTAGIIGGSLADGDYTLTVDSSKVRAGNDAMTADHTDEFFRYFGDADGDRDVDARDRRKFRRTYRKKSSVKAFNDAFDFDGNGVVDARDLRQFRKRFRTVLGGK